MTDAEVHWHAAEDRGLGWARARLPLERCALETLLARISRVRPLPAKLAALDIGCGCGTLLAAMAERGIRAFGVDASRAAAATARRLAAERQLEAPIILGEGERLACREGQFDLVIARSVLEHADDPYRLAAEAFRVLRPGGVLYAHTTNALCPKQNEIRGYPCFSWYPGGLKRRLMMEARDQGSARIGGTQRPALYWFTPGRARRLLAAAGFGQVFDRWQLASAHDLPRSLRALAFALRLLRWSSPLRLAADVFREGSWYLAVKGKAGDG